ncbi:hypothetical protein CANARDRAFT_29962 [[Candida] arabinofermentans NRRL YB-2248]|uniref:Pre-mRNA-splicing factor CWC24 n=1 Tax=[Candida] arabinofermentans NRRL YB-2248 TaxID=983967 RepID=A0A1E4SVI7_9ASCO|nr:hypothetical protein CANARDRAFT_29962 [[Candida] arabinofermentans NRRL YB-2248]
MFKKRSVKKVDNTIPQQRRKRSLSIDNVSNDAEPASDSDSSDNSDSDDEIVIKKPILKKGKMINTTKVGKSNEEEPKQDLKYVDDEKTDELNDKTDKFFKTDRLLEEEHENLKLSKELKERRKKPQQKDADGDKIYQGSLVVKSDSILKPKPAPTHIKTTMVMDYQADVCKDFLKNGYCGFGDTCKFLHYRDEFKVVKNQGVREWESVAKKHKRY